MQDNTRCLTVQEWEGHLQGPLDKLFSLFFFCDADAAATYICCKSCRPVSLFMGALIRGDLKPMENNELCWVSNIFRILSLNVKCEMTMNPIWN